jgi:hypothetical protein
MGDARRHPGAVGDEDTLPRMAQAGAYLNQAAGRTPHR